MRKPERSESSRVMVAALAVALLIACLLPSSASARKPVIAYLQGGILHLYDAELATEVPAPSLANGTTRFGISANGRYVVFNDAAKKIHLLDRSTNAQVPLPGIDVYANPAFLTVSSFGLIAFDDNANGPARAYNSNTGQFVPTGFAANNGHRQTQLSGGGGFLATTCMTNCVADLGNDTAPFVQNLNTLANTGAPNVNMSDEEDPCIDGTGFLVGWHRGNPMKKDIFIFNRLSGAFVPLPGLNTTSLDETFCVLDAAGEYVGFARENDDTLKLYDRASGALVPLPPAVAPSSNNANQIFSEPPCDRRYATLIGTSARDILVGTPAPDVFLSLEGDDRLVGLGGRDVFCGGKGKDKMRGGKGRDRLLGEEGRDILRGGPGKDRLIGGQGRDRQTQ